MSEFKKVVVGAAKALAKVKIGPLSLSQIVHLPNGPLYVVTVGDLAKGWLPSAKDLIKVNRALRAEVKKAKRFKGKNFGWMIFPPFIEIKQFFLRGGTFYLIKLGSAEHHIIPDRKDLTEFIKLFQPEIKRLGDNGSPCLIYGTPFVDLKVYSKTNEVAVVFGSKNGTFTPSAKDVKACREVVYKTLKDLGIKRKNVVVEPATYKNYK